jgi:glycosyltransferase involved in cell wall biosynthesis
MKISLVISTYNRPDALYLCLKSVLKQTRVPDEVIIADDGSSEQTHHLIEEMSKLFPYGLKHAWQEDKGFRLAAVRNLAVRNYCSSDYVIFIDGDIILDKRFIADHERLAENGYYVVGSRVKLTPLKTNMLIKEQRISVGLFCGGEKDRINALYLPWLSFLTRHLYFYNKTHGRGANMAFFYNDLVMVNGFDEDFESYGREDTDIFWRLNNAGIKQKVAKFQAITYHLYHTIGQNNKYNDELMTKSKFEHRITCINGLKNLNQ